jgi:ornithine--oxo-acid transaminase
VPFGDAAALDRAVTQNTCAVLIEPIQGEAGILVPPDGYLRALREICDRHGILLILDEVQSGLGRTGKWFAHQHEGIRPDGLILGKALGGGVYPVSALVGTNDLMAVFDPGSHGSTFGGKRARGRNRLGGARGDREEGLVERSAELGRHLMTRAARHPQQPRRRCARPRPLGRGRDRPRVVSARALCETLMREGVLTKDTHGTVLRFAPPLTIARDEMEWGLERVERVLTGAPARAAA